MTRSRRLDDRNVETRKAWLAPRRIVAWLAIAATVAAIAFVLDSLRQSVAQLGAVAANVAIEDVRVAPLSILEPLAPALRNAPAPSQPETPVSFDVEPALDESPDAPLPVAAGPPSGDAFAQLVEAGVLRDVGADPEAAADLRRVLEAAALEAAP